MATEPFGPTKVIGEGCCVVVFVVLLTGVGDGEVVVKCVLCEIDDNGLSLLT